MVVCCDVMWYDVCVKYVGEIKNSSFILKETNEFW